MKSLLEESAAVITSETLPKVRGDSLQMAHAFQNILSNALKYRKKDVPPQVQISAKLEGGQWIVAVTDNGIGFESQYAERIFGLFKRLHIRGVSGYGAWLGYMQARGEAIRWADVGRGHA